MAQSILEALANYQPQPQTRSILDALMAPERPPGQVSPQQLSQGWDVAKGVGRSMFVDPLWDMTQGVRSALSGDITSPEAGAGLMAAIGMMGPKLPKVPGINGNRQSIGLATTGAQPVQDLAISGTLPVNVNFGTIQSALQRAGVQFRQSDSASLGSPSQYFYVETPDGIRKKIRVSDHLGDGSADLEWRYGKPLEPQLKKLYRFLGLEYPASEHFAVERGRLQAAIERWPDSPAIEKWKTQMNALPKE